MTSSVSTNNNGGGSAYGGASSSSNNNNNIYIDTLDANPRTSSNVPTNNTSAPTTSTSSSQSQQQRTNSYYADDDSAVSSNVTEDPEVAILTRDFTTDTENARNVEEQQQTKGVLPRNRKEWCIVIFAILLILIVALAIGLGLGFFFLGMSNNNNNNTEDTTRDVVPAPSPPEASNTTTAIETTNSPTPDPLPSLSPPVEAQPNELAVAIQEHVIKQAISDLTSFDALDGSEFSDGGTSGNSSQTDSNDLTPQQMARDFIVLQDTLPVSVGDEEGEQVDDDDDPRAIPSSSAGGEVRETRPYITTDTPAYRVAQRYAAAVLYYSTNGPNWETNNLWLEPGVHECDFVGVTCELRPIPALTLQEAMDMGPKDEIPKHDDGSVDSTMERMIVAIDLPENKMTGEIPQEVMALPYLTRLGLWSNEIEGSLPSQLGELKQLSSLLLDDNSLKGYIPSQLGELSELTDLSLGYNEEIGGRIPPELGNLSKLERLSLSNMSLSGPIPAQLGQLSNLEELQLDNNRLSRGLPNELAKLTNLETLSLNGNELTGTIPDSWARTLTKLKRLEIQGNDMKFDIDDKLCALRDTNDEGSIGLLEALVADCQGDEPKVTCSCCTSCFGK